MSKSNGIKHLAMIERAAFFGESAYTTTVDPDTGQTCRAGSWGLKVVLGSMGVGTVMDNQTSVPQQVADNPKQAGHQTWWDDYHQGRL
jgi:hypothetical protein